MSNASVFLHHIERIANVAGARFDSDARAEILDVIESIESEIADLRRDVRELKARDMNITWPIDAIAPPSLDYKQKDRDHEALINKLHKLLKTDDIDGIRDLVEAEHDAIHGPNG
jgi:hypothetical protein